jgi:hypothetical protein
MADDSKQKVWVDNVKKYLAAHESVADAYR